MWADTLFRAEQQYLLRLLLWAATSILGGTAVGVLAMARRKSPLLTSFAVLTTALGAAIGVIAAVWWRTAALRDLGGAARLERLIWMMIGLDIGGVATGAVLATTAWMLSRRLGGVGAGIAIAIQGLALLVLDVQFANIVSR